MASHTGPGFRVVTPVLAIGVIALGAAAISGAIPIWITLPAFASVLGVASLELGREATRRAAPGGDRRLLRSCRIQAGVGLAMEALVIPAALVWLPAAPMLLILGLATIALAARALDWGCLFGRDFSPTGFRQRRALSAALAFMALVCTLANIFAGLALYESSSWAHARIVRQLDWLAP